MIPTVIKVYLCDDPSSGVDVPITPNTTALDVVECCKEPGEIACHLSESWKGKERSVGATERPYTILQQWSSQASEVRFFLRHYVAPDATDSVMAEDKKWGSDGADSIYGNAGVHALMPNCESMTLAELKDIAQRQQQQIEKQQRTLVGKEQRLRFLKQQMQQHQAIVTDNEKLQRLREMAEMQEAKLRKIRSLRGKVEKKRYENTHVSSELEAVRNLFEEKQRELAGAMTKVRELTNQLDELRKGSSGLPHNAAYSAAANKGDSQKLNDLEKLRKEMDILNRMNEEQHKRLGEQRLTLQKRNEDVSDLDRRIEDLTMRLRQKRMANGVISNGGDFKGSNLPSAKMHTIVAAVEPLMKQSNHVSNVDVGRSAHMKGALDQNSHMSARERQWTEGFDNRGADPKAMVYGSETKDGGVSSKGLGSQRPQSAMAQLFPEPQRSTKAESLTAKVRPMLAKLRSESHGGGYYPLNKPGGTPPAQMPSSKPANLFAYKPPPSDSPQGAVTRLPTGNIKYHSSGDNPPPYPTAYDGGYRGQNQMSQERSITVDIEALRRKFAHAPRPLKKRSSITEAERPQGPNIPKLLYDQIYKKADTPFYRPQLETSHRSTPPPAYVEPSNISAIPEKVPGSGEPTQTTSLESRSVGVKGQPLQFHEQQSRNVYPRDDRSSVAREDLEVENDQDSSSGINSPDDTTLTYLQKARYAATLTAKSILKPASAPRKPKGRRIRFDPLALLLDASLEGEFDLVKKIIPEVPNPSGANDEGITALHNAVCAGHFELVRFLVHYGSDINAADTDGWTPLHCAASCNNLPMARFLVENGACIFASTLSDGETAADKCEELDEGYIPCSEYLYGIQEKLGNVRQGQVYALFNYTANNEDELSFQDGDYMVIIRKGDQYEREWWWAQKDGEEGYIPRNLLGMWPRIKSKEDHD